MEEKYYLFNKDCLQQMKYIKDKSIDLILCDLPYGTTKNTWDEIIPYNDYIKTKYKLYYENDFFMECYKKGYSYEKVNEIWNRYKRKGLWTHYERIIKDNGCILLFAQSPFDKTLAESNKNLYRYEWIWNKTQSTGFLNAKKMPMKCHESILVFYKNLPTYNPQMTHGHKRKKSTSEQQSISRLSSTYGKYDYWSYDSTDRYPRDVITFPKDMQKLSLHPTQKPLALCKYLISTYTNPDDIVLDNCMGSGTTGVAAVELGRKFIGVEKDRDIYNIAVKRMKGEID